MLQARRGPELLRARKGGFHANGGGWISTTAPNNGTTSAMLPFGRVAEIRDRATGRRSLPAGRSQQPTHRRSMSMTRRPTNGGQRSTPASNATTVVLPDGRILIVNGHGPDADVRRAACVDPANSFAYSLGVLDSGEVRGYHGVALLLPDGRVLVGGGRDISTETSVEKPTFRCYCPIGVSIGVTRVPPCPGRPGGGGGASRSWWRRRPRRRSGAGPRSGRDRPRSGGAVRARDRWRSRCGGRGGAWVRPRVAMMPVLLLFLSHLRQGREHAPAGDSVGVRPPGAACLCP